MRPIYATSSTADEGFQTAYTRGLSYFPDYSYANEPLGDITTELATGVGLTVGGPAGAAAGSAFGSVLSRMLGGSAVDSTRKAKAQYVLQRAMTGNVAAAQVLIAAPSCVSGNEAPYWRAALETLRSAAGGPDVIDAAQRAGPTCLSGAGDTATNYPALKNFLDAWDRTNAPLTYAANTATNAVTSILGGGSSTPVYNPVTGQIVTRPSSGISPLVLIGGAAIAAFVVFGRKGRR